MFPIGLPIGPIQLRRGSASEPFLKFIPHEVQSPICVGVCVCVCVWGGAFEKVQVSATKFKYRKNLRGGRIPARPCLLDGPKTAARPISPPHFWRMAICDSSRVGGPLSPKTSAGSIRQQIRKAMWKLGYGQGRSYSPHSFRRGETDEINDSGSNFATIIKSGTWAAAGFMSYLDLQRGESLNISPPLHIGKCRFQYLGR